MLLNMHIIAQDLEDISTQADIASPAGEATLTHAEIYDPELELIDNVAYVVDGASHPLETLPPTPFRLRIVYLGEHSKSSRAPGPADIVWARCSSAAVLLARVQRIFRRYELWDERLKSIMLRKGVVAEFLDGSIDIFSANILVHDRDLKTIAYKTHGNRHANNPLDTLKEDRVLSRDVLNTFMKSVRMNCPDADPFAIKGPHFWESANGPQSLNMNVFHRGSCIARVVLTTRHQEFEPTNRDVGLLMVLSTYIEASLASSFTHLLNYDRDTFSSLLGDMLNGKTVTRSQFREAALKNSWDHWNDTFFLLAVETNKMLSHHLSSTYPLISVFSRVNEMIPEAHTFTYNGRGLVLFNLSKSKSRYETLCGILNRIAVENGCIFGSCRSFTGLKHLKQAYTEAVDALSCITDSMRESMEWRVVHISDIAMPLAGKYLSEHISPITFCPHGLVELIRYDNAHHSELYPTMRAYIESNCSPTKSAKALYVQRSTFLYRFKKAQEILDLDLEDPETQLRLRLSFKLLDMLPRRDLESL